MHDNLGKGVKALVSTDGHSLLFIFKDKHLNLLKNCITNKK